MKSMLRCVTALAVATMLASSASAALIAEFNYNAGLSPGDASTDNAATQPSTTSGSFFPFTSTLPVQTGSSADTNPVMVNGGPNNANAQRSAPAPQEASGTRLFGVNVDTTGFMDLVVEWDFLGGFRTSRFYQLFATTDGVTFDPVPLGVGSDVSVPGAGAAIVFADGLIAVSMEDGLIPDPDPAVAPDYLSGLSFTFPSGTAHENNPDFGVRIAAVHDPAVGDYVSSFAGTTDADAISGYTNSTSAGGGTIRYDLVRVSGNVIPEPATLVLVMSCLVFVGATGRRR